MENPLDSSRYSNLLTQVKCSDEMQQQQHGTIDEYNDEIRWLLENETRWLLDDEYNDEVLSFKWWN